MKKVFSLVLFVILTVAVSVTAFAADSDIIASGYCGGEGDGTNVVWTFGSDGVMTFSGTGAMADYGSHYTQEFGFITNAPWWIYADQVKLIVIEENITYFGAYALDNFGGIAVVKGQPYFGEKSLYMQDGLPSVYFFGGPPAGAHETAYNSVYKMYYLESTEDQWDIQSGFWQGHRMYPYTIPDEAEFNPADFTCSGYCGTDPFILGKEIAWGYDSESKTLTIMGTGNMQNYEPDYVDAPWYPYHEDVEKIVVNEGIIEIGDYSFYKFSNIKEISLPSTAVKIGKCAFCDAKISGGFEIPENVEVAHEYAFSGFTAAWLYIPQKTSFAYSTFSKNKIGEFRVSGDSWSYSVNDGVLMSKNGEYLISFPGARKGEYSVSEKVKYISENSFAGSNIDKVFIPKNVQAIRTNAFTECAGIFVFEGTTQIADKTFSSRLNSTVSIYFMGGEPSRTSSSFIDKKTNKGKVDLYYLSGTEDLWEFNENGLWGIYEVKPFTAYEEVELDPSLYVASGYCGADPLTDGKNLAWGIDENGVLTIFGKGEMADYEYGKLENGQWAVNSPWYEHSEQIKTLVIKEGITHIGDCAFRELSNVSGELVIPKSVAEIGMQSFYGSQFDGNLVIPGNVKTIGSEAFCEWRSVEYNFTDKVIISEGVETIGDGAFAFGYFKSVTIPSTVKNLGKGIFSFDGFLNEITINENNKYYCIEDGIIYTKDIKVLKECLMKKTGDFIVPESVETIEKEAFWNTGLSSVTVTKNVKYIGAGAFGRCYYPIYIEGQLNYIGENAFNISRGSSDVYFLGGAPKEVVYNPNNSYMSSFNENINIYYLEGTEGWEVDENGLWNGFKVTPFTVGEEVELDPSLYVASGYCGNDSLISGKNLAWGIDKNGVLKIFGKGKMDSYSNPMSMRGGGEIIGTAGIVPWYEYERKLTGLIIEEGITNIGSYAFWSMGIPGELKIPSSVKIIGDWSFCANDFVGDNLIIPEGVEKIGNSAFQAAGVFENAYIPASVIDIQGEPFRYCETKNIFTNENNQYYKSIDGVFFTKDTKELVQFPDGRSGSYVVPETVTVIGRSAFESSLLSSVMIEGNIDSVENVAFQNFNGTVVFNGTVSEIAGAAFSTSSVRENKLKVIFMAGPPKTFIAGDEWSNSFGEGCAIYYLSGTEDLWEFDENGLWNGYEVTEYSGYGDLNSDFTVDVKDVYLARLVAAKLVVPAEEEFSLGDVDGNGRINAIDANLIRKFCANIITKFPVEG